MIDLDIQSQKLEGSPEQIAEQIFHKLIGPMFDHLKKTSPDMALQFGFCVAGNAVACYMNSCDDIDQTKDLIMKTTEMMASDIKRSRKKLS